MLADRNDESEIMAELRMIREEMLAEFPTDEALFGAMQDHEAEQIKHGKTVVYPAARRPRQSNTNSARARSPVHRRGQSSVN
jgi:hypothetical protein